MKVAEIVRADGSQLVRLPEEFHLEGDTVSIRRQGEAIVLEPVKPATWPPGFFDRIRIDDPAFARPSQAQGPVPPAAVPPGSTRPAPLLFDAEHRPITTVAGLAHLDPAEVPMRRTNSR